ncbi:MAG: nitrate reductase cytochrome c-type subunit; periplasmic nitrate reductase electron transfer subunit [Epsilonproteobacteria bacterium]|nr:nitrate reductase cytochrome c-type subunit; periplasmic nitrate reductase electron transfer subunit [Campylobacterota bacterium]
MKKLLISSSIVAMLFAGQYDITGVREAPLTAGSQNLPQIQYNKTAPVPGQVKKYKKSFVTAPPMIPHDIENMVPIKIGKNECLGCHMPQTAKAMGITSIPKDHFVDNFDKNKKTPRIAGSRYNCTQCHAPQTTLDPVVENKFKSLRK